MAEEVGALRAELGLDNSSFKKAIQDVNRQLKVVETEFKAASSQVGAFEDETDKLRATAENLTKRLDLQRDKVETLRRQFEQSAAAKGEDAKETQNLQIQLNKATTYMNRLEGDLNSVNQQIDEQTGTWKKLQKQMDSASQSLKGVGDKMKDVGGTMSAAISLPLAGAGTAALKFASDMESSQDRLQASLGTTEEEAQALADVAQNVWRGAWGDSIGDVTQDVQTLRQVLGEASADTTQQWTEAALTIKDVFGADVNETANVVRNLVSNFEGLSESDAFDLITVGFQQGGDYAGDLLDTLKEYAPQFSAMGMSADEMLGILISGAEAGAWNLDKVGDAVKEFQIRAQDGSDTTAEGFAAIGLSAEEMGQKIAEGGPAAEQAFQATLAALASIEDPLQRNQAGVALFGTQWEDLGPTVVSAMAQGSAAVANFEGATQKAADAAYDNFGTRLTSIWREMQTTLEPIGNILLDMAEDWLPKVSSAIEGVASWFTGLSSKTQNMIVIIGGLAAAVGPLLAGLGFMTSAIAGLLVPMATFIAQSSVMVARWAVMGTQATVQAAKIVAAWASTAAAAIANTAVMVAQAATVAARWAFMGAQSLLHAAKMAAAWVVAMGPIAWVSAAVIGIVALVVANWETVKDKTTEIWGAVSGWLSDTWDGIQKTATKVWNSVKDFFGDTWDAITWIFKNLTLPGILISHWDSITATINAVWNSIKDFFSTTWTAIQSTASSIFTDIRDTLSGIWDSVFNTASTIWTNLKTTVVNLASNIKDGTIEQLNNIWDHLKSIPQQALQWGKDIMGALADGIASVRIPLPDIDLDWDEGPMGIRIPDLDIGVKWRQLGDLIPGLADGGNILRAGSVLVGERGPEILNLPRGAQVQPLDRGQGAGGKTVNNYNIYGLQPADVERAVVRANRRMVREWGVT